MVQSLADSPTELVRYLDGRPLDRIPVGGATDPALSPDGRFVAFSSSEGAGKRFIRVYDFQRGLTFRVTSGGNEATAVWSAVRHQFAEAGRAADDRVRLDGVASQMTVSMSAPV